MDTANDAVKRYKRLVDLPPSAKLVYLVLRREGPFTQTNLANEALLPQRTTRSAVKTLKDADLIEEELYLPDARKQLYQAKEIARLSQS